MNLIEDYLRAVAALLPAGAQREDIIAELRDLILSRVEAREAELGRRLSDDEVEAVLRAVGHPIAVAAGYGEGPRHVVGPTLYPYWAFAVKAAIAIQLIIAAVVMIVRAAATGNVARAMTQAIGSAVTGSLILAGVATLVCWLIERRLIQIDYANRWRVRDLRPLQLAATSWRSWPGLTASCGAWTSRARDADRWRRERAAEGLGAMVGAGLVLLWWTGLLPFATTPTAAEWGRLGVDYAPLARVDWAGLKAALFWPVIAWCAIDMARGALGVARPEARPLRGVLDLAVGLLAAGVAWWLWSASPLGPIVRFDSLAGFALRLKAAFGHAAPVDLTPLLTIGLGLVMLNALGRIGQGLGLLLLRGQPRAVGGSATLAA